MVKVAALLLVLAVWIGHSAFTAPPQSTTVRTRDVLPPVSWTCPMHPDIVEDKAGICPICRMKLEPARLDSAWSCPVHTAVAETKPGSCPICRRDLVRITVSLVWTCPGSTVHEISPGRCPDGSARAASRERRPHGDHNPRHGGLFFMAPDNWHHLEGTYPRAGVFRVFVYDDYTKPLSLSAVTGRAVTKEAVDPALKQSREIEAAPLRPSKDGGYLEARIPSTRMPAEVTAKIRFTAKGEEYRFDFAFPAYSKEPASGVTVSPTVEDPAPAASLPMTVPGLLAELAARSREVDALIQQGAFAQVYVPALSTKDLALALEAHAGELPAERRPRAAAAAKRVVLAAWLLDLYGDLGDKQKLTEAYHALAGAVGDLTAAHAAIR